MYIFFTINLFQFLAAIGAKHVQRIVTGKQVGLFGGCGFTLRSFHQINDHFAAVKVQLLIPDFNGPAERQQSFAIIQIGRIRFDIRTRGFRAVFGLGYALDFGIVVHQHFLLVHPNGNFFAAYGVITTLQSGVVLRQHEDIVFHVKIKLTGVRI